MDKGTNIHNINFINDKKRKTTRWQERINRIVKTSDERDLRIFLPGRYALGSNHAESKSTFHSFKVEKLKTSQKY